jgi:hypothetical protein
LYQVSATVLERTADGPEVCMKFGIGIVLPLIIIGTSDARPTPAAPFAR